MIVRQKEKRVMFECSECHLLYREKKWAMECESWCRVHKSCNLEITSHAVMEEN